VGMWDSLRGNKQNGGTFISGRYRRCGKRVFSLGSEESK